MATELKACPFCGGQAVACEADVEGETLYLVSCEECGVSTPCSDDPVEMTALWNKRVSS